MKLVLIHGRAQGKMDPKVLQTQWLEALNKGLKLSGLNLPSDLDIQFPYYGDALDEFVIKANAALIEDVNIKGSPEDAEEVSFKGELVYELASEYGITDDQIQKYYNGKSTEKGPLNWEWVQSIIKAFDETPIGSHLIDLITRDVYVYLNFRSVRNEIDKIVSDEFSDKGSYVVIGHSLGSVVGYNVLSKLSSKINVKCYITVGSPLGVRAIKNKLDTPLSMPVCLKYWFNALDERDVVPLYILDKNNFNLTPEIENKINVNNHTKNRHGISGYLDDPEVAVKIYEALTS